MSQTKQTERRWSDILYNMAEGATVSDTRPMENILSEKEVLMKAAEWAEQEGALHPSYFRYKENPELLTAKVETPLLLFHPDGVLAAYKLSVINDTGTYLGSAFVRPGDSSPLDGFVVTVMQDPPASERYNRCKHLISKREAVNLIKDQFPDSKNSEPVLVNNLFLEDNPNSNSSQFWYFTVSGTGGISEYIIDGTCSDFKPIPGDVLNLKAIKTGEGSAQLMNNKRRGADGTKRNAPRVL
jgi:hypothetical protein